MSQKSLCTHTTNDKTASLLTGTAHGLVWGSAPALLQHSISTWTERSVWNVGGGVNNPVTSTNVYCHRTKDTALTIRKLKCGTQIKKSDNSPTYSSARNFTVQWSRWTRYCVNIFGDKIASKGIWPQWSTDRMWGAMTDSPLTTNILRFANMIRRVDSWLQATASAKLIMAHPV